MAKRKSANTMQVHVEPTSGSEAERRGVLVVLGGGRPGQVVDFSRDPVVVGRSDEASLVMEDESLSRCHARFTTLHGRCFVSDLASTNGTFVNGERISSVTELKDGMRIQCGKATLFRFSRQDEEELEAARDLYEASVRDPLTGLFNRYCFDERLASEFAFAKRHERPLALIFVDADHFKRVNDTYGHAAGDEVLRRLAELLLDAVRTEDTVARIGGEEFVVLVRDIEPIGMLAIGERLRAGVEALRIEYEGQSIPITVSIGVATLSQETDYSSAQGLLAQADAALYRAKEEGRNRVHLV